MPDWLLLSPGFRRGRWKLEAPILAARKLVDLGNGGQRQATVDVGKQLGSAFEVLVDDRAAQPRGIDLQQNQIRAPGKDPVGDIAHLVSVRAVDEALGLEGLRRVDPQSRRLPGFRGRGDVIERGHGVGIN
jgi:hypothetical protein